MASTVERESTTGQALDVVRGNAVAVTSDVAYLRVAFVNVLFYGPPGAGDGEWVLIDAGLPGSASYIAAAAAARYGPASRPSAIVLTHCHFDHVGALGELAERWDVPVYAHPLELPYVSGRAKYPPPDPTVGGGAMARLSPLYPRGPFDVGARVRALPDDGSVPGMDGWRWIFTPGHSPGHVALWRDADHTCIAGDAVVTTKQESMFAALTQRPELHGPPAYFTQDWDAARDSARRIAELEPDVLATGHGRPMAGPAMRQALQALARDFDRVARPRDGRYVRQPALFDETGPIAVPPAVPDPVPKILLGIGAAVVLGAALRSMRRRGD